MKNEKIFGYLKDSGLRRNYAILFETERVRAYGAHPLTTPNSVIAGLTRNLNKTLPSYYGIAKRSLFFIFHFSFFILLTSCGVYSLTGGDVPASAKTFSVAQFTNQATSVNPNLTQQFTDALRDKMTRETKLKQISDTGDFAFSGHITSYYVAPASIKAGDQAQINRLTIGIEVVFVNKKDPKKNFDKSFSEYGDFDVSKTLADVETALVTTIDTKLVQDIYNAAVMNW